MDCDVELKLFMSIEMLAEGKNSHIGSNFVLNLSIMATLGQGRQSGSLALCIPSPPTIDTTKR